jgi:glucokinase
LTGGIFKAGKWLLEPTQEAFEKHIFHNMQGRVKLLLSTLETSDREVLGASALAWDVEEYSLFK